LIKVDNQPFIKLIKLLINLVSLHCLSRFSGKFGGMSYILPAARQGIVRAFSS
jgi:hypothetical protein